MKESVLRVCQLSTVRERRLSFMKLPEELKVSDMTNSLPTEFHLLITFGNSLGSRYGPEVIKLFSC